MAQRTVTRRLAMAAVVVLGMATLAVPVSAQGTGPGDEPGLISETTTGFIGETEKNVADDTNTNYLPSSTEGASNDLVASDPLGLKRGIDTLAAVLRGTVILETLLAGDEAHPLTEGGPLPWYVPDLDSDSSGMLTDVAHLIDDRSNAFLPDIGDEVIVEFRAFMDKANPLAELRDVVTGLLHGYGTVSGLRDVLSFSEIKDLVMSIGAHGLGIMPGDNIGQAVWKAPAGVEPTGVTDSHDRFANQDIAKAEYLAPGVYIEETSFYQERIANEAFLGVAQVETAIPAFMYSFWLQSEVASLLLDWLDNHQEFIIQKLEEGGYFKVEIDGVAAGHYLRSALEPWTDVRSFCGNVLDACPNITALFDEADAIFGKGTNVAIDHVGAGFLPTGETAIFSTLIGALDAAVDALNIIIDHVGAGLIEIDPELGIIILDQDGDTEVAHLRELVDRSTSPTRDDSLDDTSRDRDRSGDGTGDRTTTTTAPTRSTTTTAPTRSTTTTTAPTRSTTTTAPPRTTTTTAPPRTTTTTAPSRTTTTTTSR